MFDAGTRIAEHASDSLAEVRIEYKDWVFTEELRFDLLVEGCLLIEVKSVQEVLPIHKAQLLSYMKLLNLPLGLLLNFHEMRMGMACRA